MKGFSKKTTAFLLFFAAVMPVFIIGSLFVKQTVIQHNMEEQIESSPLQTLTVNASNFKWIKEGKEAEINGRLFDVKEYNISGSTITLKGIFDDDELEVKETLSRLYKTRQNNESSPVNTLLIKFFNSTIIDRTFLSASPVKNKYFTLVDNAFNNYSESLMQQFLPVATPPPNI